MHFFGKTLLVFALLPSVFQGQICLLLQVFLDFLLCIPVPLAWVATPCLRLGAEAGRTPYPRGGSQEEQPHLQGAVPARVQEGLEELFHIQGQKGR